MGKVVLFKKPQKVTLCRDNIINLGWSGANLHLEEQLRTEVSWYTYCSSWLMERTHFNTTTYMDLQCCSPTKSALNCFNQQTIKLRADFQLDVHIQLNDMDWTRNHLQTHKQCSNGEKFPLVTIISVNH